MNFYHLDDIPEHLRQYFEPAPQIGLESSPAEYVDRLVAVFREVWRVLRDDGSLWLNIGDSYANDGKWGGTTGGEHVSALHGDPVGRGKRETGLKPKDLIGIPWRLAFALQADGWYLRSEIIWAKRAPMPESVQDRPTSATEKVFLLTKRARYFYDAVAVQEEATDPEYRTSGKVRPHLDAHFVDDPVKGRTKAGLSNQVGGRASRNLRNFWLLSPDPYADAHFATFPRELPKRAILAGTSAAGCCPTCGAPWKRVVARTGSYHTGNNGEKTQQRQEMGLMSNSGGLGQAGWRENEPPTAITLGWSPSCACDAGDPIPCTVLDPFLGSGTTVAVATSLGRDGVGIELNPAYVALAHKRIGKAQPALVAVGM